MQQKDGDDDLAVIFDEALARAAGSKQFVGILNECLSTLRKKNADYAGQDVRQDVVAHFRAAAAEVGIPIEKAWLIFFRKHTAAIASFCRNAGTVESEPIRGRIIDAINYLLLFSVIAQEIEDSK